MGQWSLTVSMETAQSSHGSVTAGRDYDRSEVILKTDAAVCGPGRNKKPLCLGCLSATSSPSLPRCVICSYPVCGESCHTSSLHVQECGILSKARLRCPDLQGTAVTDTLDFITPLRLLLKLEDKETKEKFAKLEINLEAIRKRNSKIYGADSDTKIIDTIKNKLKYPAETGDIERAIAIVEKYSMTLDASKGTVGVFRQLGSFPHSCSPNTYSSCTSDRQLVVRAGAQLVQGAVITVCRVDPTKCNLFRKRLIQEALLDCNCIRCKDGSEYGTGFGSLVCGDCEGSVSSTDPGKEDSDWECVGCNKIQSGRECVAVMDSLNSKLEQGKNCLEPNDYEKILLREGEWAKVPANSQLMMEIRHRLIYIYQYHKDFYFPDEGYLQRKISHCDEWLRLQSSLFPGLSYQWALVMFEKVNASVSLMTFRKMRGDPAEETNAFISEIASMTKEPIDMMKEEEDQSYVAAIRQSKQIAVEAREEQKKRVLINMWAEDDDEDWTGYS